MALARARQAARRTKDRWKSKQWYKVVAPPAFSSRIIAETLADEPDKLATRRVEVSLFDLTGDMRQMHVKLFFQVSEVLDNQAKTTFDGHTMTSDYVRRLTRRGSTKIPVVFDVQTKDGSRVRVKPFAIADRHAQTTQAQAIRQIMVDEITKAAQKSSLDGFLAQVLVGELTNEVFQAARKIHPVRRIEIARTEIIKAPAVEVDETPVVIVAPPSEAAPPTSDAEVDADAGEEADTIDADSEE